MNNPSTTIIVVPRDRFSLAEQSFASLRAHTPPEFPIIYVDSCHPNPWAQKLDVMAARGEITLIRTGFHVSQGEAYNLGLARVRTKYVLCVDNDVLFTPGWADKLVACAEETGAAAVMPVVMEKESNGDWHVHMCGGDCGLGEVDGKPSFVELHAHYGATDINFQRCQTGLLELHSFLVDHEALRKAGAFDEKLWIAKSHVDFSLMVRATGGTLWQEPASVVKFELPPPLELGDLGFFLSRWSARNTYLSTRHFYKKWKVPGNPHDPWMRAFRRRIHIPIRNVMYRWLGRHAGRVAFRIFWTMEPVFSAVVGAWADFTPNRRARLEALGPWRPPSPDPAVIEALSQNLFRQARPLHRELTEAYASTT